MLQSVEHKRKLFLLTVNGSGFNLLLGEQTTNLWVWTEDDYILSFQH